MITCRSVVLLLLLAAVPAVAQQNGAAGIDPMAGTGAINNDLYTNSYYGFSFRFPTTWRVLLGPDSIASQGGCAGDQCRILALQAQKGMGRVTIDVKNPSGSSARDLLTQAAEREQGMGFQPAGAVTEKAVGDMKFYRQDLSIDSADKEILETVMTAEAKGDVVVITILSDSRSTLDELASAMQTAHVAAAKPGQAPQR